ncbi:MAG: hypothetical protein C4320_04835 [Armatimonadota bacterium]
MSENVPNSSAQGVVKKRSFLVAGGCALVAVAFAALPSTASYQSEDWVSKGLPMSVPGYQFVRADPNLTDCSYKMDPVTYEVLKPWGIVARVFSGNTEKTRGQAYDVVVIAGNDKDSFHDPAVCFTAQKWMLTNHRVETINTKTRGQVPVTMVDMQRDNDRSIALYVYRVRSGYVADNVGVKLRMFAHKFTHLGRDDEGGFIRIIPRSPDATAEQLKAFTADWIDEAAKSSGGYY